MASSSSLPAQHPHLALHLTDRALTPIISSSLPPPPSSFSHRQTQSPAAAAAAAAHSSRTTFTTSPPSSSSSSQGTPSPPSTPTHSSPTALSLAHLTATALTSYQTAKRLTHGAPLRTMVEYPAPRGPVVLHSYLCPMSLALGTPGRLHRSSSQASITTAAGGAAPEGNNDDGNEDDHDANNDDNAATDHNVASDNREDPDVPMLIATVIAPAASDLKDARRAAGRLEYVARAVQSKWVAQGSASSLPPS